MKNALIAMAIWLNLMIGTILGQSPTKGGLIQLGDQPAFVHGVNLPWLDGAYGNDFGVLPEHKEWGCSFNAKNLDRYLADLKRMNTNVVRIYVFEGFEGLEFDGNGHVSGIQPRMTRNVAEALTIADKHGIKIYFTLANDFLRTSQRLKIPNPETDTASLDAYLKNAVIPFAQLCKNQKAVFAFDVMNEPEQDIPGPQGNHTQIGITWDEMRTFIRKNVEAIHRADQDRLVSCGSGYAGIENVRRGLYSHLGLDFYDVHVYYDEPNLVDLATLKLDVPVLIGEYGQASKERNADLQKRVAQSVLNQAVEKGYAGALAWAYDFPGVKKPTYLTLLEGQGNASWRPVGDVIQNFSWRNATKKRLEAIPALTKTTSPVRFKLSMDEFGNCVVSVESTDQPLEKATEFEGETVQSTRLPKSSVLNNKKGLVRLVHDFSAPDTFEMLFTEALGKPLNARLDQTFNELTLTSRQTAHAKVTYAYRFAPPFKVVCDGEFPQTNSTFQIVFLMGAAGDTLAFNLASQGNDKPTLVAVWIESRQGKRETTELVVSTEFPIEDGIRKEFRLPLPNAKIESPCLVFFGSMSSDQAVQKITGLLVEGKVTPLFGIGFDERRGVIFTKQVVKGSLAEQAGIQTGDVVVSINKEQPTSVEQATMLLSSTVIGDTAILEIERAGKKQVITIKSE